MAAAGDEAATGSGQRDRRQCRDGAGTGQTRRRGSDRERSTRPTRGIDGRRRSRDGVRAGQAQRRDVTADTMTERSSALSTGPTCWSCDLRSKGAVAIVCLPTAQRDAGVGAERAAGALHRLLRRQQLGPIQAPGPVRRGQESGEEERYARKEDDSPAAGGGCGAGSGGGSCGADWAELHQSLVQQAVASSRESRRVLHTIGFSGGTISSGRTHLRTSARSASAAAMSEDLSLT